MKKGVTIIYALLGISSLVSFFICAFYWKGLYAEVSILPLSFFLSFMLIFRHIPLNKNILISYYLILAFSWFRMTILPLLSSFQNLYADTNELLLGKAVLLVFVEHFVISVLVLYFSKKYRNEDLFRFRERISLKGNRYFYLFFVLISLIVYLLWGRDLDMFDFIVKPILEAERPREVAEFRYLMILQITSSGILFFFLYFVEFLRKHYLNTNDSKYINISIFLALVLVSFIVGERRSNQVYIAFASVWMLTRLYPVGSGKIVRYITLTTFVVLLMMTVYKQLNAFLYSSYTEAIANSDFLSIVSANILDAYFFGLKTIIKNIEFSDYNSLSFGTLFNDLYRNIFGINYLFGKNELTTAQLYNYSIYSGDQMTGFLYSSIVYGYTYFGVLLAPMATGINVLVVFWLERTLKRCRSLEMTYVMAYIYMRFAFGLYGNFAPLLNTSSRFIVINGGLFLIAFLLNARKIRLA